MQYARVPCKAMFGLAVRRSRLRAKFSTSAAGRIVSLHEFSEEEMMIRETGI